MKTRLLLLLTVFLTAFSLNAQTSMAIVGERVGGWPGEAGNPGPTDIHQMTLQPGSTEVWEIVDLVVGSTGGLKFRGNNSWALPYNFGVPASGAQFPTNTAVVNAGDFQNIPAGTYTVTFNTTTLIYNFSGGVPIPTVKLIGSAVSDPNGVTFDPIDAENFTATNVTLLGGNGQIEVDGSAFGGTDFPTGAATDPGLFIPIVAGTYSSITYNTGSGDYSFVAAPVFPSIAIVGEGAGGWPGSPGNPGPIDNNQMSTTDGETYRLNTVALTIGADTDQIKFRSNNNWNDPNYGGFSFPTGPTDASQDIFVTAPGLYRSVFTRSTGAYVFDFPSVAIVGEAVGGWPGDPGNPGPIDVHQLTTTDGETYTISNLVVTTATTDGGAKFRYDNTWSGVNSGGDSFPSSSTSTGGNIPTQAGTYDLTFTRSTGGYGFTPSLATSTFNGKNFSVYPNPSTNAWNFTSNSEVIKSVQVMDVLGKVVATSTTTTIDASTLNTGIYFARVSSENGTQTIKLVKN